MSYSPPAGNAANFGFAAGGYTAPAGNHTNFPFGGPPAPPPHQKPLFHIARLVDDEPEFFPSRRWTVVALAPPPPPQQPVARRPRGVTVPCPEDRLDNLRSLCTTHDAQIKEDTSGQRHRGGRPVVKGCDVNGWPLGQ